MAACAWWRVAITTASTASSASRPRWSVEQRSKPNLRWALAADSPVAVATSTSRTSAPVAQVGQEHAGGVAAGPDHAEPDHRPGDRPRAGRSGGLVAACRRCGDPLAE